MSRKNGNAGQPNRAAQTDRKITRYTMADKVRATKNETRRLRRNGF